MESLIQNAAYRGKSLETDEKLRLSKRPTTTNSLQDFGSSFSQNSNPCTRRDATGKKGAYVNSAKRGKPTATFSDSEDEILLTSHSEAADKDESPPGSLSQLRDSKEHTSEVVKRLKFNKNKRDGVTASHSRAGQRSPVRRPSQNSSTSLHRTRPKSSVKGSPDDAVSSDCSDGPLSGQPTPRPTKIRTGNRQELALEEIPVNSQARSQPRGTHAATEPSETATQYWKNPVANTRRPTLTQVRPKRILDTSPTQDRKTPTIKKPQFHYKPLQVTDSCPSSGTPRASVTKPKDFLAPSPISLHDRPSGLNTVPKCKPKVKVPEPKPFPLSRSEEAQVVSKDTIHDENLEKPKPRPRPKKLGSSKTPQKASGNREQSLAKGKRHLSRPAPQPFPMSTQVLQSMGCDEPSPSSTLHRGLSYLRSPKSRKKKLKSNFVIQTSSDGDSGCDWDKDFSALLSVDPNLLCPFCDALLPKHVTPHLRKLINLALKKSRRDPRPGNPLGHKAPSAIFITVCQRHQFECEELPKAEANGWPTDIDWEHLGNRINSMQDTLEDLLSQLRDGMDVSPLWKEFKQELQAKGSRAVASVREQFASFEKAQAGYYGELGYAIIHQTLLNLFPPNSYDLDFVDPLTPEQFVQRILVPEVATRLIREDLDLCGSSGYSKALQVLRDSSKYGVAMFPDDGNDNLMDSEDPHQLGVADQIVMERARKRRKELAETLQQEEEIGAAEEWKKRIKRKNNNVDKMPIGKESRSMDEHGCETEGEKPKAKPRPRPKIRSTSVFSHVSTSDHSGYEGSVEQYTSFPHTSQESTNPYNSLGAPSEDGLFAGPDEEILVPDSDADSESSFARRVAERIPSRKSGASGRASVNDSDGGSETSRKPPDRIASHKSTANGWGSENDSDGGNDPFFFTNQAAERVRVPSQKCTASVRGSEHDSDGGCEPSSFTMQVAERNGLASENITELTSSEDVKTSALVGRPRKKRRDRYDGEDDEKTPKPSKHRRTGLAQSGSQPLLLAKERTKQSVTESPFSTTKSSKGRNNDGDGIWSKSMMDPVTAVDNTGSTARPQQQLDPKSCEWLFSDNSQEQP